MFKKIIFVCVAIAILSGCTPDNRNSDNKSEKISEVEHQINQLQNEVNQLSSNVSKINKNFAVFTPASKGYTTVYANVGYFVVSLDSLKKYANGYRATFSIGNPNLITFNGITLHIQWGEAPSSRYKNYYDWINSFKSEKIEINKPLLPGIWNKITVVLSPATPNETGVISLSITTNQILLHPDLRGNSS